MSFARAEGLHAHGHAREACALGARLARELLARPPALGNYGGASAHDPRKARRRHAPSPRLCAASHRLSCLASATLAKCAFLCTVSDLQFLLVGAVLHDAKFDFSHFGPDSLSASSGVCGID